jgi:hypothetical protein
MGIVYLLQPPEFIDTNILKIGHSTKNDITRCKSYGSKCVIYNVRTFSNSSYVEKVLLGSFNKKFKLYKGKEYFEGDVKEMDKLFYFLVTNDNVIKNGNLYDTTVTITNDNDNDIMSNNISKKRKEYNCFACNFKTNKKSNYDYHINCNKHFKNLKDYKNTSKYTCSYCNYNTDLKSSYVTHLLTNKHKKIELEYKNENVCKKEIEFEPEINTNIETVTETNIEINDNNLQINNLNKQVSHLTNLVESLIKEKNNKSNCNR